MHVVFRESHGLDQSEPAPRTWGDAGRIWLCCPFSDSDLGAFAAAGSGRRRAARLCGWPNLVGAETPLSVDTYAEQTLAGAKAVLVRLIGGESYWPYGLATCKIWRAKTADRAGGAACGRPTRPATARRAVDAPPFDVKTLATSVRYGRGGGCACGTGAIVAGRQALCGAGQRGQNRTEAGFTSPNTGVIPRAGTIRQAPRHL